MSASPTPLEDGHGWGLGVDVGGTRVKAVLRRGERVLARHVEPTPPDIVSRMGPALAGVLTRLVTAAGPEAPAALPCHVGLVVPGIVAPEDGIAVWSANLGWRDLDVPAALAGHVGAEVVLGHDVRAGLLGEHRMGAARGVEDVLFVPVGTGIAAALLSGGRPVRGGRWAGELGHVTVAADGPECACGRRGCLEAVAGGTAIARRWQAVGGAGDAAALVEAMAAGSTEAAAIWADVVQALAGALAPVVATAGTRLVLIGGGLAAAGELLLAPLRASLAAALPGDGGADVVRVDRAGLGDWAGAIGAAWLEAPPGERRVEPA